MAAPKVKPARPARPPAAPAAAPAPSGAVVAVPPPPAPWWHTLTNDNGLGEKAIGLTAHFQGKWVHCPWISLTKVIAVPYAIRLRFDMVEFRVSYEKAKASFPASDFRRVIQFQHLFEIFDMPDRGVCVRAYQYVRDPEGGEIEEEI